VAIYDALGGKDFLFRKYELDGVHPAQVTDILRLLLIEKFGGVYVDIDTECHQPIDALVKSGFICYTYGFTSEKMVLSFDVFGAAPNHRLIKRILSEVDENMKVKSMDILSKYGYRAFQKIVVMESSSDTVIYGKKIVDNFLTHHFYNSWCSSYTQ
jgi:mannosyltransferase OCH1-like enzyme